MPYILIDIVIICSFLFQVSFIDYGTVSDVDISDVKYLGSCFSTLPAQALRGCLSNIKPRGLHWSHEATTYFLSVVSELLLYAKITEIDREVSTMVANLSLDPRIKKR